jgi:hypothetical protein
MIQANDSNRLCVVDPNKSAVDARKTKPMDPSIKKKLMTVVYHPVNIFWGVAIF